MKAQIRHTVEVAIPFTRDAQIRVEGSRDGPFLVVRCSRDQAHDAGDRLERLGAAVHQAVSTSLAPEIDESAAVVVSQWGQVTDRDILLGAGRP